MSDSVNLKSEAFKMGLYDLINESGLPIANVYYIFKMVDQDLEKTYMEVLKREQEEENGGDAVHEEQESSSITQNDQDVIVEDNYEQENS